MNPKDIKLITPKLSNAEPLADEAIEALRHLESSRRDFLRTAGIMMVGFSASGVAARQALAQSPINPSGSVDNTQVDSWIAIGADDSITVLAGKSELGQGMRTLQLQLAAEELTVDVDRVTLVICRSGVTPNQGLTVGSLSTPTQFGTAGLRVAIMTARDALNQLAAQLFDTTLDDLTTTNGVISMKSNPTQSVSYGQLVLGKRFNLSLNPTAVPKPPSQWKVLGHSVPLVDTPAKAKGTFQYVQKVRVPGMLHGKVVRPAVVGAHFQSMDKSVLNGLPGNPQVFQNNDWVGVVADTEWHAIGAAGAIASAITWSGGATLPAQADLYTYMTAQPAQDSYVSNTGDVDTVVAGAAKTITARYLVPFQMHGSLGSSCAVADVHGTGKTATAKIWSATQGVYTAQAYVSGVLGVPAGNVEVTFVDGSGCYGHNGAEPVTIDATLLSQAAGKPVRVQYSRRDEMTAGESYGHPMVGNPKVALDANGKIIAWDYVVTKMQKGEGATSAAGLGNSNPGALAGYATSPIAPTTTPAAPASANNFGNWIPNYTTNIFNGVNFGTGSIPSERVLRHIVFGPFFTAWLRAPDGMQNSFIHESFMDEIAASLKTDPVQHRLRYLTDPRLSNVVNLTAQKANWAPRPSPAAGNAPTGVVTGRGFACNLYGDNNGYTAMVAEVTVDQDKGVITVTKMTASIDTGPVVNPDNLRNQMEGCALQCMSRTLREEVKWNNMAGIITSGDWIGYPVVAFGDPLPEIDTILINNENVTPTGAGEVVVTVTAAAIGNAVFDATGARMRQIPFTPANFLAAKSASAVAALFRG
jgi:nicotinate dehydrogenase subunit B